MPARKKHGNTCSKRNSYISNTSAYKRNRHWLTQNNITSRQLKDLNEMMYNTKATSNKRKQAWKVVPKDSCEVYKDRRQRQIDAERKKEEKRCEENDQDKRKDTSNDRRTCRRITRRRKKYNSRRRDSESSSSYSTLSCCTTCSSYMDYE